MITSVPVGAVRAGYLRWCWALGTLAPPHFGDALSGGGAAQWLQALRSRDMALSNR